MSLSSLLAIRNEQETTLYLLKQDQLAKPKEDQLANPEREYQKAFEFFGIEVFFFWHSGFFSWHWSRRRFLETLQSRTGVAKTISLPLAQGTGHLAMRFFFSNWRGAQHGLHS